MSSAVDAVSATMMHLQVGGNESEFQAPGPEGDAFPYEESNDVDADVGEAQAALESGLGTVDDEDPVLKYIKQQVAAKFKKLEPGNLTCIVRSALGLGDRSIPSKLLNLGTVVVMADKLCSILKTQRTNSNKLDKVKLILQSIIDGTSNITLEELLKDFDAILDETFPAKPAADSDSSQPVAQDPIQMASANGSEPLPQTKTSITGGNGSEPLPQAEIQIGGSGGSQPQAQASKDTAGSTGSQRQNLIQVQNLMQGSPLASAAEQAGMSDADWRKEMWLVIEAMKKGREEDQVVQALLVKNMDSIMNAGLPNVHNKRAGTGHQRDTSD